MTKEELNNYCTNECPHNDADFYCEQCELAHKVMGKGMKRRMY